jgi:hypothetical protein
MGKRSRKRSGGAGDQRIDGSELTVPTAVYTDAEGNQLELRGSLTPRARSEYAATLSGGSHQEDAYQRAGELLFERLAVSWTISAVRTDKQKELLGRYRMATAAERQFVRDSLREHVAEYFPDVQAP